MKLFDITGQVALVTGGSRGIGRAMAIGLAQAGATVAVVSRKEAQDVVQEIEALGGKAYAFACDLADREARVRLFEQVTNTVGHVDIVINNAGIQKRHDAEVFPLEDWDDIVEVNLTSVFHLCQLFGRPMLARGYGKIINIASVISFQGGIRIAPYAAAKAGVMNFTKTLSNEWSSKGVNVNCIAPGYIATDMNEALLADGERNKQILERIPSKRWGEPADFVGAAIFLSSKASDYVCGQTLLVDGGWMGR